MSEIIAKTELKRLKNRIIFLHYAELEITTSVLSDVAHLLYTRPILFTPYMKLQLESIVWLFLIHVSVVPISGF